MLKSAIHLYILTAITAFSLITCNSTKTHNFSINTNAKTLKLGDTLRLDISNPKNIKITTVSYSLDDEKIDQTTILNAVTLGKKTITATITLEDNQAITLTQTTTIYNNTKPQLYNYTIVNTYPHDVTAYTQGLEFYNGVLYESTGQKGSSTLRKVNFENGEVLKHINLSNNYFGEGITILNDSVYQLTWQAKTGFIYNVNTFEKLSSFTYGTSKEGWGLCNNGKQLYKSDGTEKIWVLNTKTLTEQGYIEAYTQKGKIPSLNELEWVNGKIFANIYQYDGIAIINPKNGAVEGVINLKTLKDKVTKHDKLDVLNGIAYHPERNTFFVTGKNWDKLFEIKITPKAED